jgi:hypothetical protein
MAPPGPGRSETDLMTSGWPPVVALPPPPRASCWEGSLLPRFLLVRRACQVSLSLAALPVAPLGLGMYAMEAVRACLTVVRVVGRLSVAT